MRDKCEKVIKFVTVIKLIEKDQLKLAKKYAKSNPIRYFGTKLSKSSEVYLIIKS